MRRKRVLCDERGIGPTIGQYGPLRRAILLSVYRTIELLIDILAIPGRTLRERAARALREAITDGRLAAGQRLPPSRAVAGGVGVS
ncbi:MAG: hypothetical protein ACYDA6_01430, partial [Solirubrobacteraceae bacterium]